MMFSSPNGSKLVDALVKALESLARYLDRKN